LLVKKHLNSFITVLFLADYDHLYRKMLRGGSLDVSASIKVLKSFLRQRSAYPQYFGNVFPFSASNHVFDEKFLTIMPYRSVWRTGKTSRRGLYCDISRHLRSQ
jgi:hypothetical protein